MVIKIKDFVDSDPKLLYNNLETRLKKNKGFILDFHKLQSLPYEFLEATVGKILDEYPFDKISKVINFINVDAGIKEMLSKLVHEKNNEK